jgi:hypothetical protein
MTQVLRRDLLKGIMLAGAVRPRTPHVEESPDVQYAGPWTLRWGGWRSDVGQDTLHGFWTAVHVRTGKRVYSTTGGIVQGYFVGHVFDLSIRDGRTPLTPDVPKDILAAERQAALERLKTHLRVPLP